MTEQPEKKDESSTIEEPTPTQPPLASRSVAVEADSGPPTRDVKRSDVARALQQIEQAKTAEGADIGNTTNDLQQDAIKAIAMKAEQQRLAQHHQAPADDNRPRFTTDMMLRLDVIDSSQPIIVAVQGDVIVGRADNVTDYVPDIDLTPFGAYRMGLSRRHALIRLQSDGLIVKDLSSRNGTFVNGTQVKTGETLPFREGDELRFGNLAMRVSYQKKS